MTERTIFVTGSSTGLGRAAARLFASRGWRVFATMRRPEEERALGRLPGVTVLPLDVRRPDQVAAAAAAATARGPVDVVFNNAGYGLAGPLEGTTEEQVIDQVDTNLLGVIRTTRAFVPHFRERGAGLFVTTTSIGGLVTFPLNSVYHATKWALEGFSESLAFELRPFGIRVKTVAPGGIRTDFLGRSLVLAHHRAYSRLVARTFAAFEDPAGAGRYATPEEIAAVVYEAATDGTDRLRYVAGEDARSTYALRRKLGDEAFREVIARQFFGESSEELAGPRTAVRGGVRP